MFFTLYIVYIFFMLNGLTCLKINCLSLSYMINSPLGYYRISPSRSENLGECKYYYTQAIIQKLWGWQAIWR